MSDKHYPTVDLGFVTQQLNATQKVLEQNRVGSSHYFVMKGSQPVHKRTIIIRPDENGQVGYLQATGLAARYGFLTDLMAWLLVNKGFKEGGYIVN